MFLGLNHNFLREGPPILFETMIFGGRHDEFLKRCATWDEAEAMHVEAVQLVRSGSGRRSATTTDADRSASQPLTSNGPSTV